MFESFKPSQSPKRMWLAMLVIAGLGLFGVVALLLLGNPAPS
jgi:hypothetical protein